MIAASSLAFPPSKTLALWWRQLTPFQPESLRVGHLFVHRLEALAEVIRTEPVEPLPLMLLRTVALELATDTKSETGWLKRLDERLHLGQGVIGHLLRDVQAAGFLSAAAPPALTDLGRLAAEKAGYPRQHWQRREFVFVERNRPDGQRLAAPHFLPLAPGSAPPWQPDDKSTIAVAALAELNARPQAWKDHFGFPADVQRIADPADSVEASPPAWQRVVVDRPQRLLLALISSGQQLLGFAARQEGWELRPAEPIMTVSTSLGEELPELAEPMDAAACAKAWQTWCSARQIPAAEIEECKLSRAGAKLNIQAPSNMMRRLEAANIPDGDAWLLGGDGYVRAALQLQILGGY